MATNTNPFYTYSATAGSSKTLQKPQDGGDNNQWGNYINTDLDEIVAAVNALSDKIADANEKTLIEFTATGSAVNHVEITNAAAGNGPTISAAGSESDVDLNVTAKGTGDINLTPGTNGDVNIPASKGITFGDDGEKIEGDGTDLTIASSNDLNLTATTDINVPADVGLTFGNDGEKIEGDGTDLTIASSATLNVNTGSASGNDLKVNTSQLVVEGDTGNVGIGTSSPDGSTFSASSSPVLDISGTRPLLILNETDDNTKKAWVGLSADHFYLGGTNTSIRFFNDTTERVRIDSAGNVELKTTNADLILPSGGGISFQNHSVSSATGASSTTSDNVLDDYEEGTFTPVFADASSGGNQSSTGATANYTKIGNQVTLFVSMNNIDTSGLSGPVYFQGLPFTSSGSGGVCCPRVQHVSYASGDKLVVAAVRSDYIALDFIISGNFDTPVRASDLVSGSADFEFTLTYKTP